MVDNVCLRGELWLNTDAEVRESDLSVGDGICGHGEGNLLVALSQGFYSL